VAVENPAFAAAAQAIGLAIHELATNAGKYGALSVDAGRVDVGWRLDGDIFAMSWVESKGPPVLQPKRRGFGSTVVDPMVRQTINGEVHLDFIPRSRATALAATSSSNAGLARERNRSPALVRPTLRVVRMKSTAPTRSSSARIA
jgi:hypothetical protein